MALTDMKIKRLKPGDKPFKVSDGQGLTLIVQPTGGKWWRFRYRIDGKEKSLSFGTYPDVPLESARAKRLTARQQVAAGIDPSAKRKTEQADRVNTLEHVSREWHGKHVTDWAPGHAKRVSRHIERDIFPILGAVSIKDVTPMQVLDALRLIEGRGAVETAKRVKVILGAVYRYAIASGYCTDNPVMNLTDALTPSATRHFPALTDPVDFAGLLRAIDGYQGSFIVQAALKMAPLVFVRPGELRQAEWSEIDFETGLWIIPAEKMKMRQSHSVPLSRQAIAILKGLQPFTSGSRYVFPAHHTNDKPMSNNAILGALRRMDFGQHVMTGHGFRACFRTIADEVLKFRIDIIEHQLAHTVKDPNGRAYNRTSHLPERVKMMQTWADYLDKLKAGAKVIPFPKTGTDG